jgi:hypothetical protein
VEVDLQLAGDAGVVLLDQRRDRHDPGVVDDDVERPETALDLVEEGCEAGAVGDVDTQAEMIGAELGGHRLRGGAVEVADRYAGALGRQRARHGASDTATPARDRDHLARERARLPGH